MCRLGVGWSEENEKSIPGRGIISKSSKGLEEETVGLEGSGGKISWMEQGCGVRPLE